MGSQTLEILRQGVWASFTGGWFYDPHQNLFCNTVHLYIWLFLLCLPFSIYLYFPPAILGWIIYCLLVAAVFTCLKLLNHGLHHLYDTTECIIVQPPSKSHKSSTIPQRDEGMEMQMLRLGGMTANGSDNESITSLEYHKPNSSTIDLKVDVHRKNSSESSIEDSVNSGKQDTPAVATTKSDLCIPQAPEISGPSSSRANRRPKCSHKREPRTNKSRRLHGSATQEASASNGSRNVKTEDSLIVNVEDGPFAKVSRRYHDCSQRCSPNNKDFLKEWLYLDGEAIAGDSYPNKFSRQFSSDSRDNSEPSVGPPSPKKRMGHRRRYNNYQDESCTKSAMALATAQSSNMRRNSNSTMSTIQLPLLNSTAQLVSQMRRHSNNADAGFFASVELGAYMMDKADEPSGDAETQFKGKVSGVRRIKSAALEIGCPPPSVSNLSPHPNSAETIGGQVLKNPKSAVIPPPSKSLMRGSHLNLYPRNETGEGCSYPYLNYGSEIVYPIAEISDEMQTSQKESDLESSGDSYSAEESASEGGHMKHQFRGFDWEAEAEAEAEAGAVAGAGAAAAAEEAAAIEQSPAARSSDSDYENNGSRSPLLERAPHGHAPRPTAAKLSNPKQTEYCSEKNKVIPKKEPVRLRKLLKDESDFQGADSSKSVKMSQPGNQNKPTSNKLEEIEYLDQASASSKDLLIEKSSLESNENFELSILKKNRIIQKSWDHKNISDSSNECNDKVESMNDKDEGKARPAAAAGGNDEAASVCSIRWLFKEPDSEGLCFGKENSFDETFDHRTENVLEEAICSMPKNLGAIPKQIKNLARARASSQKENKNKDSKRDKEESPSDGLIPFEAVEAQVALVQGLECLFAATNANTVVMPSASGAREERARARRRTQRHAAAARDRENSQNRRDKTRKRSIEEAAQCSTNTILPTSMPLLAAFLNSRVDLPHVQVSLPDYPPMPPEISQSPEENPRFRPLMDRNHRNRVRKIKRSTRQRNNPSAPSSDRPERLSLSENPNSCGNVHFATSFEDTTDGAIHCFMDEYGNWMSYTFDKNSSGRAHAQRAAAAAAAAAPPPPIVPPPPAAAAERGERMRPARLQPLESADSQETAADGSCGSLDSEPPNSEHLTKSKRGDSIDHSSSNQGSNNPLLSSNNNLSAVVPINTNSSNKRFYVFDGGTSTHNDQPRSPVAYVTDSLLEQIEAERQSRMGFPSMHISFLMSQRRAQQAENISTNIPSLMPSIGEESLEMNIRSKFSKLMDEIEKANQPKPKSYYNVKLFKRWDIKISLDRLKLMALFDRNLTFKETFFSIILAVLVAVLGSMVLNLGFYRDIYAFWFCFVMAGSQYSLLKSVQPDSASPVHGFNKMVVFSRPVYFCLCSAILCGINSHITVTGTSYVRPKRSNDAKSSITLYGIELNEQDILKIAQSIMSIFLLTFPFAFSLGFFPQVTTFLMYLLEQLDMHVLGGNAACSLAAAGYCVARSLAALGLLYGFAYSGLLEGKKTQHQKHNILMSIFCALLVPIAYHLSRSASDYTLLWNLVKKHLLPPELYALSNPDIPAEADNLEHNKHSEELKTNNSESNISKQNSLGSSVSKVNFSSETNIAKVQKKSHTSSVSSFKLDPKVGESMNSNSSLKAEAPPAEPVDKSRENVSAHSNVKVEDPASDKPDEDMEDPLPKKLQATVNARLKNDVIVCTFLALLVFGLHCTTVFTTLRPQLNTVLWIIAGALGWVLHYLVPQLRKQQPWLCLAGPVLRQYEHGRFEVTEPARLMCFEKIFVYLCFLERNVLYPALVVAAITQDAPAIADKYGDALGALLISVCALKCLRNAYSDPDSQYLIVVFAVLLFQRDLSSMKISESFLMDYFITAIIFTKVYEFLLKVQFVVTYIAPWQITWGSAFHAFAQPFSVPHSAMLFLQAAFSALLSSPLTPALGSAIFMTSYVRPVKFWERDYNTKRVDQSNTRLSSHLDRNLGSDDNNLNSIFYEHLTRSLQHYLCGDLMLGRWGQVQQGDCFVLASDYLNCLVHIVELGNGLVSFQLRGLEFRGTYCQQREVEAISEGPEESNDGVCTGWWCNGRVLSPSAMFSLRWLAWQLASAKYSLEGYSVSDNSAVSMLQVFDFRKVLLTYYVKSIIYYTVQSAKLEEWLTSPALVEALKPMSERNFVDLDPIFNVNLDEDYDFRSSGITRSRFCTIYQEWIVHCGQRRGAGWRRKAGSRDSPLVTLCYALSLVGRRALAAAQHLSASSVEFFLYGLHSLFKGDFRITSARDEWVFTDITLLQSVLAPAIRMALKLHQDHFMFPEEYCSSSALYSAISSHSTRLVICHEAAPAWRYNVLRGAPHLLALRHVMDEGSDDYKIIMLNKRHLGFRVIKLNRECVRGLWAGQQQELVYLRNRNPERGSIQNAKQALRNIINSSCDQPIGYPIYVSPLTTSYADTSEQLGSLVGGAVSVTGIQDKILDLCRRIRRRCGEGCSSGGGACDANTAEAGTARTATPRHNALHLSRTSLAGTRGSLASAGKPTSSTLASLAGLLREHSHERTQEEGAEYTTTQQDASEPSRRSEERLSGSSRERRERSMRARSAGKEIVRPPNSSRARSRRERARPTSFRLLGAERLGPDAAEAQPLEDRLAVGSWDGCGRREQPRRAASAKSSAPRPATPDSSLEDLTLSPQGLDLSLPDCKIIANRNTRQDARDFKRYYTGEGTSKDLSKPSKEIRHERESYRELTGRYIEKPDVMPLKELAHRDLSSKETSMKKEPKKDKIKTKIKRSDSGRSEPKASVSVGSKVLILEPLGVYDCINLGRRIDVQWPSELQRERGGRSFWGSWVPLAGMDGLVVHKWTPCHRDPKLRSHVDKCILLVQIDDKFVPIAETCVQDLGDEV